MISPWVSIQPVGTPENPSTLPLITFDATDNEKHEGKATVSRHPVETGSDPTDNVRPQPVGFTCTVVVTNTPDGAPSNTASVIAPKSMMLSVPILAPSAPVTRVYPVPQVPLSVSTFNVAGAISAVTSPKSLIVQSTLRTVTQQLLSVTSKAPIATFDAIKSTQEVLSVVAGKPGSSGAILCTVYTSTTVYQNMVLESWSMPRERLGDVEFTLVWSQVLFVSTGTTVAPKPSIPAGVPAVAKGSQATTPPTAPVALQSTLAAAVAFGPPAPPPPPPPTEEGT